MERCEILCAEYTIGNPCCNYNGAFSKFKCAFLKSPPNDTAGWNHAIIDCRLQICAFPSSLQQYTRRPPCYAASCGNSGRRAPNPAVHQRHIIGDYVRSALHGKFSNGRQIAHAKRKLYCKTVTLDCISFRVIPHVGASYIPACSDLFYKSEHAHTATPPFQIANASLVCDLIFVPGSEAVSSVSPLAPKQKHPNRIFLMEDGFGCFVFGFNF